MPSVPILQPKKVVQILKRLGFEESRQVGSHLTLKRLKDGKVVTIPIHPKTLGKGLMYAIIKKSGLTVKEFIDLL